MVVGRSVVCGFIGRSVVCGRLRFHVVSDLRSSGFLTSPGKPFTINIRDRMKFLLLFEEALSWNCWILLEREAHMTLD
jgi:hypothetical protein